METFNIDAASEETEKNYMKQCHENMVPIDMEKTRKRFLKLCRENNITTAWLSDIAGSDASGRKEIEEELSLDRIIMMSRLLKISVEDLLVFREPEA